MEIVTGHRGTPHITPYKVRDFNIGTVGAEDYVMNSGSELEAQLVSNNRIDIKDGSICMQGTHAVIPKNINDELTIENGMQGEKRIDLIVARYEKVADSGVESVNTVVLQGTPSKETPNVPGHVVGDIRNGDLKHEMPLYEVELDGINITEVRPVFKKLVSAAEQQKMIESLNGKISITANGICKKYNNGIMEQYIKVNRNTSAWSAWKYMYYAEVAAVDYLEPFKDITYLNIYLQSNNVAVGQMTLDNGTLAKTPSMYALRPDTANSFTVTVYVHVIGKWK